MQKFQYRSPRFAVDIPVEFLFDQSTLPGTCRNISTNGMKLELPMPMPLGACGTLMLSCQQRTLYIGVRVAYSSDTHEGVEFLYQSDSERHAVARLIASLALPTDRPRQLFLN